LPATAAELAFILVDIVRMLTAFAEILLTDLETGG
jgi:hypothetical protein